MADVTIAVLEGDETGQELLEEALRVLDNEVIGLDLAVDRFDLSLENRRATKNQVVLEAAAAIRDHGLGLRRSPLRAWTTWARRTGSSARRSAGE